MQKLVVKGPVKLTGEVSISRAKNAYLPILAAVLLTDKKVRLKNLPDLRDIRTMLKLLGNLGVTITKEGDTTVFDASTLNSHEATYDLVKTMRASIFVLGPLLARLNKAKVSLPGGCAIGTRPIDIHLSNLEKMGAKIDLNAGYVEAISNDGLVGTKLPLSFPSVGATENLMMAGVFAKGTTVIENAAMEPEIDDLANFLNSMGAKVSGIGTSKIIVEGVEELFETDYEAIGDRIEAATYIIAGLMTKSSIKVTNFNPEHLEFVIDKLKEMGGNIEVGKDFVNVEPSELNGAKIETAPFPGFPTDVQAQMVALLTQVNGNSFVKENIFENRFMHVPELMRLGAKITQEGKAVFIEAPIQLKAAPVMCTDLRASAALVIAALCAEGETVIDRIYHLERGYEKLTAKLQGLGANIEKVD
ncbi:MAG: UDP-N-acetylglucosamine 1-carboxyvinyltransferase [Bacteriovorax sp. MedPE-SWde]|nr:MAG: UDP-N-acetylglucosamine 1-carboxyvinyltransferase [Bacteriovorax sp. MedPE-SWde]